MKTVPVEIAIGVPRYALGQLIRAAISAGQSWQAGAPLAEVERLLHIKLGETAVLPLVRPAARNRPIGGTRYADIGDAQVSAVHGPKTGREQWAARMLDPRSALPEVRRLLAAGTKWNSEAEVRTPTTDAGRIKRALADLVLAELRRMEAAAVAPITTPLAVKEPTT